jgi:iron complex transport system permease protein
MPLRLVERVRAGRHGGDTATPDAGTRVSARALLIGGAVLLAALLVGTAIGVADMSPLDVLRALLDELPFVHLHTDLSPLEISILTQIRLPRVVTGALVGGLLAIAGAGYQGVFRNALADPYLLGSAAGAGLGATLVIINSGGASGVGDYGVIPIAAFAGAILGVLFAYVVGVTADHGHGTAALLLGGVAVASFLTAIQTFVQQLHYQQELAVYLWLLGSLSGAEWHSTLLVLPYAALGTGVLLLHGRHLDVLSLGDDEAAALGVNPRRVRLLVLAAASLATASAVAVSGLIGFVGIIVPHIVRRLFGSGYRTVLPMSFLFGGAFLTLADLVARTALSPAELPIGVVTAFLGAPSFVLVLRVRASVDL